MLPKTLEKELKEITDLLGNIFTQRVNTKARHKIFTPFEPLKSKSQHSDVFGSSETYFCLNGILMNVMTLYVRKQC